MKNRKTLTDKDIREFLSKYEIPDTSGFTLTVQVGGGTEWDTLPLEATQKYLQEQWEKMDDARKEKHEKLVTFTRQLDLFDEALNKQIMLAREYVVIIKGYGTYLEVDDILTLEREPDTRYRVLKVHSSMPIGNGDKYMCSLESLKGYIPNYGEYKLIGSKNPECYMKGKTYIDEQF